MTSREDTLKIAQADLSEAESFLHRADNALRGNGIYGRNPAYQTRLAVGLLEKTTRRLKRSFLDET